MSVYSNTISNPWTMMIHAHHTFSTYWTVMSARCLDRFTLLAVSVSDIIVYLIDEFLIYHVFSVQYSLVIYSRKNIYIWLFIIRCLIFIQSMSILRFFHFLLLRVIRAFICRLILHYLLICFLWFLVLQFEIRVSRPIIASTTSSNITRLLLI